MTTRNRKKKAENTKYGELNLNESAIILGYFVVTRKIDIWVSQEFCLCLGMENRIL